MVDAKDCSHFRAVIPLSMLSPEMARWVRLWLILPGTSAGFTAADSLSIAYEPRTRSRVEPALSQLSKLEKAAGAPLDWWPYLPSKGERLMGSYLQLEEEGQRLTRKKGCRPEVRVFLEELGKATHSYPTREFWLHHDLLVRIEGLVTTEVTDAGAPVLSPDAVWCESRRLCLAWGSDGVEGDPKSLDELRIAVSIALAHGEDRYRTVAGWSDLAIALILVALHRRDHFHHDEQDLSPGILAELPLTSKMLVEIRGLQEVKNRVGALSR